MNEPSRLGALDGLRGLMCLWVLVGHTCSNTGMNAIPILRSPHYAVDGFMILSGFLMTYHYCLRKEKEPWARPATWAAFYIRRFFRIAPLYYVLLIPTYYFNDSLSRWRDVLHRAYQSAQTPPPAPPVTAEHVASHLSFLFGLMPSYHSSLIIPDWSLSLEMQFYLAFPILMLFVLRFGWIAFSVAASASWVLATANPVAKSFVHPSPLPLSILWFAIGMAWASTYLRSETKKTRPLIFMALAGSLSLLSRDVHDVLLVVAISWILFSKGTSAYGLAGAIRGFLSNRFSTFLADASYSVYLLHLLILTPVAYVLCASTNLGAPARFSIAFGITAAISYALAKPMAIVERRGILWGKSLSRQFRNEAISATP